MAELVVEYGALDRQRGVVLNRRVVAIARVGRERPVTAKLVRRSAHPVGDEACKIQNVVGAKARKHATFFGPQRGAQTSERVLVRRALGTKWRGEIERVGARSRVVWCRRRVEARLIGVNQQLLDRRTDERGEARRAIGAIAHHACQRAVHDRGRQAQPTFRPTTPPLPSQPPPESPITASTPLTGSGAPDPACLETT